MKASLLFQAMATAATASRADRVSPFDVLLTHHHDTKIRVSITNTDTKGYNLLHEGRILDSAPVRKLHVANGGRSITSPACTDDKLTYAEAAVAPFHGVSKEVDMYHCNMSRDAFTPIVAGQTIDQYLDIAEFYHLEQSIYNISATGFLPYADEGSTQLSGTPMPYLSNQLSIAVDADKARQTTKAIDNFPVAKRVTIESDCSDLKKSALVAANTKCVSMANAAAEAATSGDATVFETYFKDSSSSTRSKVAANFQAVAKDCGANPVGDTTSHCTDPYSYCTGDLLAYTIWKDTDSLVNSGRTGTIYHCARYFNDLPAAPEQCHEQSQATNTLHEETHAVAGTEDHAYGYTAIKELSASDALTNADTYALYANGMLCAMLLEVCFEEMLTHCADIALKCASASSESTSDYGSTDNSE